MKFGSLKEEFLTRARDIFLFDCRVAGMDADMLSVYRLVLESFIHFTGDVLVQDLTPEHVRIYIENLSDGPTEGEEHMRIAINHYAVIHEWIRWVCAQKFITQRTGNSDEPPRFPTRRSFFRLSMAQLHKGL